MEVISAYNNFANTGGAQDMALLLAKHFSSHGERPIMLTSTDLSKIDVKYSEKADFIKYSIGNVAKLIKKHEGAIILSHDRKTTTKLILSARLTGRKLKIVHVAHNCFDNMSIFTLLPKNIVAISSAVYENLITYFKVDKSHITLIPNGLADKGVREPRKAQDIRILLAGRICNVKRQLEIAHALCGRLPNGVSLDFAGRGEDELKLDKYLKGNDQMHYIGQIYIDNHISDYDYVMLCSQHEGLPLSLIEACMYGKPMITNSHPAMLDVNTDGLTGYVCRDDNHLVEIIKNLAKPQDEEYTRMSHNARKRYDERFRLEIMYEAYDALFSRILDGDSDLH